MQHSREQVRGNQVRPRDGLDDNNIRLGRPWSQQLADAAAIAHSRGISLEALDRPPAPRRQEDEAETAAPPGQAPVLEGGAGSGAPSHLYVGPDFAGTERSRHLRERNMPYADDS